MQWYLPGEDFWGVEYILLALILASFMLGISWHASPPRLRGLWFLAVAAPLIPNALLILEVVIIGIVLVALLSVFLLLTFHIGRYVSNRWRGPWRLALATSMMPLVLTLEVFSMGYQDQKSFWPWTTYQRPLLELRSNATQAARRLGLTGKGMMSLEERSRLEKEVPLTITLKFPVIGRSISAKVMDADSEGLWIYFGDGRFGPLNPRTMHIFWVDD